MCNQTTFNCLQDVVRDLVDKDVAFTAYDVTLKARDLAKESNYTITERHKDLKNDIHNIAEDFVSSGLYEKTLIDVGAPTRAYLYHPPSYDTNKYVPLQRKDNPLAQTVSTTPVVSNNPSLNSNPTVLDSDDDEGDCQVTGRFPDQRGTLTVPCYLLRACGFVTKDFAYIHVENNSILVDKVESNNVGRYTVDYHNNVRITRHVLEKAGIEDKSYKFEAKNDSIIVSVA